MVDIEKKKAKWEKQKAKGKARFILFYIIVWILYAIILTMLNNLIISRTLIVNIMDYFISITIFALAGIAAGNIVWQKNVKKFDK